MIQNVDFNLMHYIGKSSDVFRFIKNKIRLNLKNPDFPSQENIDSLREFLIKKHQLNEDITITADDVKSIYSSVYNAICYYQSIVEQSNNSARNEFNFLDTTVSEFNNEYHRLSKKYDSPNPLDEKVIKAEGRIKSPISAIDKIFDKCAEYLNDGVDLRILNTSLRDFIGFRIIVNPPKSVTSQGPQAETDFVYTVLDDFMKHKGFRSHQIHRINPKDNSFHTVNTVHDPNKHDQIKTSYLNNKSKFEDKNIFIPPTRPPYIEQYDDYIKDYIMFPKKSGYQRIHVCLSPYYSSYVEKENLPNYIISPKHSSPAIEYQFCSERQNEYAEHGDAAHTIYKLDRSFHQLRIPFYFQIDNKADKIKILNFDESMRVFFGYSFEEKFGIPYNVFLQRFDSREQDLILANKLIVCFDEKTNDYYTQSARNYVAIRPKSGTKLKLAITKKSKIDVADEFGLLNNTIDSKKSTCIAPSKPEAICISESKKIDSPEITTNVVK